MGCGSYKRSATFRRATGAVSREGPIDRAAFHARPEPVGARNAPAIVTRAGGASDKEQAQGKRLTLGPESI